jgi:hypothetical protein
MKNLGCVAYIGEMNAKKNGKQIEEVMVALDSATGQINFYKFKMGLVHVVLTNSSDKGKMVMLENMLHSTQF